MPKFKEEIDPEILVPFDRKSEITNRTKRTIGRPRIRKMTEKAQKYMQAMVDTNFDVKKSSEIAGYERPNYRGKNKIAEIQEEVMMIMQEYAPTAVQNMIKLAEKAESENVKFQATKDLLDRSGYKPTEKKEIMTNFIDGNSRITNDIINRFQLIDIESELIEETKE